MAKDSLTLDKPKILEGSFSSGFRNSEENLESALYRTLPRNIEAEQGLLGAILVDNRVLEKIADTLHYDHFFYPAHQKIYKAILTLTERGQTASPVTLKGYFENDEELENVNGAEYLTELAANVITVINASEYATLIYDHYLRRQLIQVGENVVNECFDQNPDTTVSTILEDAEARLFDLAETGNSGGGFVTMRDAVKVAIDMAEKAYKSDSHVTGVSTGLHDLDNLLGGLQESDLLILAGRPSMGKSALATTIGYNAAKMHAQKSGREGAVTAIFSLEMSSDQLATRILAGEARIKSHLIRKGQIQESDFKSFVQASHILSQVPLFMDDTPALSIGALRTRARRLKRQHGLDLIIVDYLQLLRGTGSRQSTENRVNEISEITRGLKALAKDLNVPVLALSQLSRAVEQREDKRPQLADLRESGSIEQDADVVMFLYREEYYLERSKPNEEDTDKFLKWQDKMNAVHNKAECIIAKQRHGPIGTANLFFNPHFTLFESLHKG